MSDELDWKNLALSFLRIAASHSAIRDSHTRVIRQVVTRDWEVKALQEALEEQIKIEEFHRKRIMFFITDGDELLVADPCSTWSHKQWAIWMGHRWTQVEWEWVRGFYWPETNTIYFYIGDDCYVPSDHDQKLFLKHQDELLTKLKVMNPAIYMGMKSGKPNQPREVLAKGDHVVENGNNCQDSSNRSTAQC